MKYLPYIVVALFLVIALYWRHTRTPSGEILEFGIVEHAPGTKVLDEPASPTGKRTVGKSTIGAQTTRIPSRPDTTFGYRCTISGVPPNACVPLKQAITHPPMHTPDGRTISGQCYQIEQQSDADGRIETIIGYRVGSDFQRVAGDWTIEVWYGNIKLVSKTFEVLP